MGERLSIRETIVGDGFVFLPKFMLRSNTHDVAARLGTIAGLGSDIPNVHQLLPREKSNRGNSYSDEYGFEEFPLHTDFAHWLIPPRFLLLRATSKTMPVSTNIFPYTEIEKVIPSTLLTKAIFAPRKPIMSRVLPVSLYDSIRKIYRWDQIFIRPISKSSIEIKDKVLAVLKGSSPLSVCLQNRGDTLILDNWKMLHGRGSVVPELRKRLIERVYLRELK